MLKAYAVALALTTSAPVSDNQEGANKAPVNQKETATQTEAYKSNDKPTGR